MTSELSRDYQFEKLFEAQISSDEFCDRWIAFICDNFGDMTQADFLAFESLGRAALKSGLHNAHVQDSHMDVLKKIIEWCARHDGEPENIIPDHGVSMGLNASCALYPSENYAQWVFERINDQAVAKDLFAYMMIHRTSHLAAYLKWLHENDVVDINPDNWGNIYQWGVEKIDLPLRTDSNIPLSAQRVGPTIHPSMAAKFPFLQEALNEARQLPSYDTAAPIINELARQIYGEGQLVKHLALLGPPGVGKSRVARLLHGVLQGFSVIGNGFEDVSPGSNPEKYVGHSEKAVQDAIERLKATHGGMLYIDEAGLLFEGNENPNNNGHFRQRSVQPILGQWEELLEQGIIAVFAGYEKEFNQFLDSDPGWRRRVQKMNVDPPCSAQLSAEVVLRLIERGKTLPPQFMENTTRLFESLITETPETFGYWSAAESFVKFLSVPTGDNILFEGVTESPEITFADIEYAAEKIGYPSDDLALSWEHSQEVPTTPGIVVSGLIPDTLDQIDWNAGKNPPPPGL